MVLPLLPVYLNNVTYVYGIYSKQVTRHCVQSLTDCMRLTSDHETPEWDLDHPLARVSGW